MSEYVEAPTSVWCDALGSEPSQDSGAVRLEAMSFDPGWSFVRESVHVGRRRDLSVVGR